MKNKTDNTVNHLALNCPFQNKISLLADVFRCYGGLKGKSIVFSQTKVEANSIILSEKMRNNAEVLHGDISQNQREVTLKRFKEGKFNVLVATDVAARGLDIPNVDLVVQLEPPKEIEAYIHRSGRTARAGKDGMCITFYHGQEYRTIEDIEWRAGISFKKIGPPRQEDVIKVAAADAVDNLKLVDPNLLPLFEDAAEKLLSEVDAKEALCMALAFISETSKSNLTNRSLLSGEDGLVTYIMKSERECRAISFAYKLLQRSFHEDLWSQAKGMKILKNAEGVAFDMPEAGAEELDTEYKEQSCSKKSFQFTLERASEAPELNDHHFSSGGGGGPRGRGGRGGYKKNYNSGYQSQRYNNYENEDSGYDNGGGYHKKSYNNYDSRGGEDWNRPKEDFGDIKFASDRPMFGRNNTAGGMERPQTDRKQFDNDFDTGSSRGYSRGGGGYRRGNRARGGRRGGRGY